MSHRFFRCGDEGVYEQARLALDAAWNIDPPQTCIQPAATAPRDASGRILLAVDVEFCQYQAAEQMLPQLLSHGVVEEINADTYWASVLQADDV